MAPSDVVTVKEAAERLGLTGATIYARARAGTFPVKKLPGLGRVVLFPRVAFEAWLAGGGNGY